MMTHAKEVKDVTEFKIGEIPVILRSTPSYGDIIALQITARGGVTLTDKAGVLDILHDAMTKGTPSYSKEEIDRIFVETGAVFSLDARMDSVDLHLKALKKFLPRLLPIIAEMLKNPLLEDREVELVRSQHLSALKGEHEHPDGLLSLLVHTNFFQGHPYLHRPAGFLETVPLVTRQDLVEILPKIFNRKNIFAVVIGNLQQSEVQQMLEAPLMGLPEGAPAPELKGEVKNDTKSYLFQSFPTPTLYFTARFKAPTLPAPDFPALTIALQVLDNRLFEEVRTKRGLTYAVSAGMGNGKANSGSLYVSSTQLQEAVKVIFDEVKKMQTDLIPAEELTNQIRKYTSNWYLTREQPSSQARILSMYEISGMGWRESNGFISRLGEVSPEAVREAAKTYLKDFTVAVVGAQQPPLENLVPGFEGKVPAPVAAPAAAKEKPKGKASGGASKKAVKSKK